MEDLIPTQSHKPTGFLGLPLEIRQHIYSYCVANNSVHPLPPYPDDWLDMWLMWGLRYVEVEANDEFQRFSSTRPERVRILDYERRSLQRVSRQVQDEVQDMYYSSNLFVVSLQWDCYTWRESDPWRRCRPLSPDCLRRIRHVMLIQCGDWTVYSRALWGMVLPRLGTLWIVERPRISWGAWMNFKLRLHVGDGVAASDDKQPTETEADSRERYSALKWLGETLSPEASVLLDVGSEAGADAPFRERLPHRLRHVKTRVGEILDEMLGHNVGNSSSLRQRHP
jgi:hypothetical protein